ncbi:MAG TPA: carboxylesterase family protein [Polyangiales bacterium]|nr:carboxylesterase family protein [Polyangiales bacterium]
MDISRRALLQAATALAVVPVIGCKDSDGDRLDPRSGDGGTGTGTSCIETDSTKDNESPTVNEPTTGRSSRKLFWTTEIATGRVMGLANNDIKQFKGIPYGASTGGKNRYMPPQKPEAWRGVRECFNYGPISPQLLSSLDSEYGRLINWDLHPGGMGEDCLSLNVWTSTLDRGAKKAVMVCFHGGGFASGSGNQLGFDGAKMAQTQDVVVVTVNHRLNVFGYLNLGDLDAPDELRYGGVVGIMDLAASLEWVKENIENFGGDRDRVMIFGQSGGGAKTSVMLSNPAARGLFHRAGVQSGSQLRLADNMRAGQYAELLLDELGVKSSDMMALQKKSWQEILEASVSLTPPAGSTAVSFSPVMDGDYLKHHPFDPTAPEESQDVPVIISSTLHDSALALTNFDLDDAGLRTAIAGRFGDDRADAIIKAQKAARPKDSNYLIQASAFTDSSRGSATYVQAERKAALKKAPVYVYQWDWISNMADAKFGAVHGIDVSAAFNNARDTMLSTGAAAGKRIATKFSSAWAAFAKTGDPNNSEIPKWEPFDAEKRAIMIFDEDTRAENDYRGELIRQVAPKT